MRGRRSEGRLRLRRNKSEGRNHSKGKTVGVQVTRTTRTEPGFARNLALVVSRPLTHSWNLALGRGLPTTALGPTAQHALYAAHTPDALHRLPTFRLEGMQ